MRHKCVRATVISTIWPDIPFPLICGSDFCVCVIHAHFTQDDRRYLRDDLWLMPVHNMRLKFNLKYIKYFAIANYG